MIAKRRPTRLTLLAGALGALALCSICAALAPRPASPDETPVAVRPTILGVLPTTTPTRAAETPTAQSQTALPTETPIPTLLLPTTVLVPPAAARHPCLAGLTWERAELVAVLDGDTIDVRLDDGRTERVRYVGVDTPERGDPGYDQATQVNAALLTNPLFLARDVSDRDRFGRLLRYVVSAGGSLSHELIVQGWARTLSIPPDVRCADELVALQREAQASGRGLWAQAQVGGNCHPSYPDVCIPAPPPDLDCRDIPHRRFRVLPPDPHRFDTDGDGIGCER